MTALASPLARSGVDPVRAMAAYLGLELRRSLRNRRYFVFAIGFPVVFYLLYTAVLQGGGGATTDPRWPAYFMVSMAAYGMIGASLSNAVPIAQERASGWTRQLRITPLPAPAWIATKLAVAYLTALPSLVLVGLAAVLVNHVGLPAGTWLAIGLSLALGVLPFAGIGLLYGFLFDVTSAQPAVMITLHRDGDPRRPVGAGDDVPGDARYDRPDHADLPLREPRLGEPRQWPAGPDGHRVRRGLGGGIVRARRLALPRDRAAGPRMTIDPDAAGGAAGAVGDTDELTILGTPRDGSLRPLFGVVAVLFISFPILNLLSTNADLVEATLVVIGTVVFAGLMLATSPFLGTRVREGKAVHRLPPSARRIAASTAAVIVLLAIAVTLSLAYPAAGWFALFYYASTGASTIRSTRVAVPLMILAGVLASLTFFSAEHDLGGAVVQGLSVTIIGFTVFSAIAVRRTNRALVAARHELARLAVADERSRIARDLHDTLGHSLSVIALKSELAGRLVDDDPVRAKAEMADVERVARESLAAVRETIGGFRQSTLAAELAGRAAALAAAGIDGRVEPAPEGIPAAVDAVLGWAVREGVTNIVRHGRAASAVIRIELDDAAAGVDIWNDRLAGEPAAPAPSTPAGSGLVGLRERVGAFDGRVEAGPVDGGGFRLHVSVPIT